MTKANAAMNSQPANIATAAGDTAPFGTRPPRSKWPFVALWILYAVWLGVLIYLAAFTVGAK